MLSPYTVTIYTKQDNPYNVIPDAPIEIRERLSNGTAGGLSLIYQDQEGLIPIQQTGATADERGQFTFFIEQGEYVAIAEQRMIPIDVNSAFGSADRDAKIAVLEANDAIQDAEIADLQAGQVGGIIVFSTYALLDAYTPQNTEEERASYKVTNDPIDSNNGYYSWVSGTTYTKDASLVESHIDGQNTSNGVSGFAVKTFVQNENVAPLTPNLFDEPNQRIGVLVEPSGAENLNGSYNTSDYIAVSPGFLYRMWRFDGSTIIGGRFRKSCYYDSSLNVVAGGANILMQQFTPPAGAAFIKISTLATEYGTQITMLLDSEHPAPALYPYYAKTLLNEAVASKVYGASVESELTSDNAIISKGSINSLIANGLTDNVVPYNYAIGGDYILADADMRGGSLAVDFYNQKDLTDRGYTRGINWKIGNDFARAEFGSGLTGKFITGGYLVYSDNPLNLTMGCNIYSEDGVGAILPETNSNYSGFVQLSPTAVFVYNQVESTMAGAVNALVGAILEPVDTSRFATGFVSFITDTAISEKDFLRYFSSNDINRLTAKKYSDKSRGRVTFGGSGTTTITGTKYKRDVSAFPSKDIEISPAFNFLSEYIGDVYAHGGGDNVAPIHAYGTTLLANHAYKGCKYSSVGHGKTEADIGSLYSNGGSQFVLMGIEDTNRVWVAETVSNSTLVYPTGVTLAYVSGGATSTDIDVTGAVVQDLFPCTTDYTMTVLVDGVLFGSTTGTTGYQNDLVFNESYYLMAREDIIDWYINNGNNSLNPQGPKKLLQTTSYRFDFEGNCTIAMDYTALDVFSMQDIMGMQSMVSAATSYYIPKTVAFTHQGVPLNFSMIESANAASNGGGASINFTSEKLDATGIKSDRWLTINNEGVFAMGYLPLGSAGANRNANVTANTLEIRGNTDKMYPRLLDVGDFNTSAGDSWGAVGYNIVHTPYTGSTATYPVRTNGDDYYFIDYHNTSEIVSIPMPDDYIGREFEVVESRNIAALNSSISALLSCSVDCIGDYGYLVLKVKK